MAKKEKKLSPTSKKVTIPKDKSKANSKLRKSEETPKTKKDIVSSSASKKRWYEHMERFEYYKQRRSKYEVDWKYGDDRFAQSIKEKQEGDISNSFVPIDHGLILAAMADITGVRSGVSYEPMNEDSRWKTQLFNPIYRQSWEEGNGAIELYMQQLETMIRGTSFAWETLEAESRDVKFYKSYDPITNEKVFDKKTLTKKRLVYKHVDLYRLWWDPAGDSIDSCEDVYMLADFSEAAFKNTFGAYSNFSKMKPGFIVNPSQLSQSEINKYKEYKDFENRYQLLYYYNDKTDLFELVGKDDMLSMDDPIPFHHKMKPFTVDKWVVVPHELYGIGLPKQIQTQVDEIQTIRNVRMDNAILKNTKMWLKKKGVKLTEEDLRPSPNKIIEVDDTSDQSPDLKEIQVSDTPLSSYKEEDTVQDDIRRITGISDSLVGVTTGKTATETSIVKEAALKRLQLQNFYMEEETLKRHGILREFNIKQFYSQPLEVMKIIGPSGTVKLVEKKRQIKLKGQELIKIYDEKGSKVVGGQMLPSKEDTFFDLETDFLDADMSVKVNAGSRIPISQSMQIQWSKDLFQMLYQDPYIDPVKLRESLLDSYDKNADELISPPQPQSDKPQDKISASISLKDIPPTPNPYQLAMLQQAGIQLPQGQGGMMQQPNDQENPQEQQMAGDNGEDQSMQQPQQPQGQQPSLNQYDPQAIKAVAQILQNGVPDENPNPTSSYIISLLALYKDPRTQQRLTNHGMQIAFKALIVHEIQIYQKNGGDMGQLQGAMQQGSGDMGQMQGGGMMAGMPQNPQQVPQDSSMPMSSANPLLNTGYVGQ